MASQNRAPAAVPQAGPVTSSHCREHESGRLVGRRRGADAGCVLVTFPTLGGFAMTGSAGGRDVCRWPPPTARPSNAKICLN